MKKLVTVCLGLFIMMSISATAQSKNEKAVAQAVEALRLAMMKGEKAPLLALASDQLSYGHSGGALEDKEAFADNLSNGNSVFKTIELTDQIITVIDNTAMVRHKLYAETANKGQPGTVKLAVFLVYIKQKGKWLLAGRQAVKI
ncbi:MAG: nuclear transport factor 2 family protein [Siphonobacter sp.]